MAHDLYDKTYIRSTIVPATYSSTETGTTVDVSEKGGVDDVVVAIFSGTVTDGTHTISIEESDNDSDWTEVDSANIRGTIPILTNAAADDDTVQYVGVVTTMRYLRVVSTVSGSPLTGGIYGAFVVVGDNRQVTAN